MVLCSCWLHCTSKLKFLQEAARSSTNDIYGKSMHDIPLIDMQIYAEQLNETLVYRPSYVTAVYGRGSIGKTRLIRESASKWADEVWFFCFFMCARII